MNIHLKFEMLQFLEANLVSQLATEPMRKNNMIDLVIFSQDHLIKKVAVGERHGSYDKKKTTTCQYQNTD